MAFPTLEDLFLPLLKVTSDNRTGYNTERALRFLAKEFKVTEEEKELTFGEYKSKVYRELVRICRDHLRGAGLIEGFNNSFKITKNGKDLLKTKPKLITLTMLKEYKPNYTVFWKQNDYESYHKECITGIDKAIKTYTTNKAKTQPKSQPNTSDKNKLVQPTLFKLTIEDEIDVKYNEQRQKLNQELLNIVKNLPPYDFEKLAIEILVRLITNSKIINKKEISIDLVGKTGDEGIDGIITKKERIKEHKYFIQAKCWKNTPIGRPEIQKFVGALAGKNAHDGIFITTSKFATTAEDYAISQKDKYDIRLIDGVELVEFMVEYGLGVQTLIQYEINTIDTEYFSVQRKNMKENTLFDNIDTQKAANTKIRKYKI